MDIKKQRKKLNLTQSDLAIKCKVSLVSIQLWERGVTTPNEENQKKLEEVLNREPTKEYE